MRPNSEIRFRMPALAFICLILFFSYTVPVMAQDQLPPGVTPQKVTARFGPVTQTQSGELYSSFEGYIEYWNVGAMAGGDYQKATVYLSAFYKKEGSSSMTFDLTFTGGPNGTFSVVGGPYITSGSPGELTTRAVNDFNQVWIPKRMSYEIENCQASCNLRAGLVDSPWYFLEDCSSFNPWFTECSDCTANMTWDPNLKPGEVLSPQISYKGTDGQPIAVASQALYFNGLETWSAVWDGSQVNLELQYLCPNNSAHSLKLMQPAASSAITPTQSGASLNSAPSVPETSPKQALPPQPETAASEGPTPKALGDLVKIAVGGFGIIAVATTIGVVTGALPGSTGAPVSTASETEAVSDTGETQSNETEKKPALDEKTREALKQKSDALQVKWQEIRNEITHREQQHLNVLRKNSANRFKTMLRLGLDARDTITGPVMKVIGEGAKAISGADVDKLLFDIDNTRDVNILAKGKECQAALKQLIEQLKAELKKTALEKMAVDRQLAGEE